MPVGDQEDSLLRPSQEPPELSNDLFERRLLQRICGVRVHIQIAVVLRWQ
jgi:hypothetical protein